MPNRARRSAHSAPSQAVLVEQRVCDGADERRLGSPAAATGRVMRTHGGCVAHGQRGDLTGDGVSESVASFTALEMSILVCVACATHLSTSPAHTARRPAPRSSRATPAGAATPAGCPARRRGTCQPITAAVVSASS